MAAAGSLEQPGLEACVLIVFPQYLFALKFYSPSYIVFAALVTLSELILALK